jgi:hypothetical protein
MKPSHEETEEDESIDETQEEDVLPLRRSS